MSGIQTQSHASTQKTPFLKLSTSASTIDGRTPISEPVDDAVVLDRWPSNPAVDEEYIISPFPLGLEEYNEDAYTSPGSAFRPWEAGSEEELFERLWKLHLGFHVPYPSVGKDIDVAQIDAQRWNTLSASDVITERLPEHLRFSVKGKIRATNLSRFNSHYCGVLGATVAAVIFEYPDLFERDTWLRSEILELCDSLELDPNELARFADQVWGNK